MNFYLCQLFSITKALVIDVSPIMLDILIRALYLMTFLNSLPTSKAEMDDVQNMITEERYPVQKHYVITEDNYTLGIHRIPSEKPGAAVVLLIHGLFSSASDYLVFGQNYSLGYVLSKSGYDVWLGNCRGTTFSRQHVTLNPDTDSEYWNYSFDDIGLYDIPAFIDYILKVTGLPWLHYIGHSQGCTVFFVMASERPEYLVKVRTMHSMAPGVFFPPSRSPFIFLTNYMDSIETISNRFNIYEWSIENSEIKKFLHRITPLCANGSVLQKFCVERIFKTFGLNIPPITKLMARHLVNNTPNTISTKQIMHFGQLINSGRFQRFDYKESNNLQVYGQAEVPEYNLKNVTTNLFVYYGFKDMVTPYMGVEQLIDVCASNVIRVHRLAKFDHMDFMCAYNTKEVVYYPLIKNMQNY